MRFIPVAALSLILLAFGAPRVLGQVEDYVLDPRSPLPKVAILDADPFLGLPVEAGKDYQRLRTLSSNQHQHQKMAHALGTLLKAQIMLEEKFDSAKTREAVSKAYGEAFDAADMLPEVSWLRKTLRAGSQALYDVCRLKAGKCGVSEMTESQRARMVSLYKLEDVHPDHHSDRVLAVARKFITDAAIALSGVQIISPRWSEL